MRGCLTVVHLGENIGQSICGLRKIEIRRRGDVLASLQDALDSGLKIKAGFVECSECMAHPAVGMVLLRRLSRD